MPRPVVGLCVLALVGLVCSTAAGDPPGSEAKPAAAPGVPRITVAYESAEIIDVIQALASAGKMNVIVSPKVKGAVTIAFQERRPWEALEQVVARVGASLQEEDFGIFTVVPLSDVEVEEQYYRFRSWRPASSQKAAAFFEHGIGPLVRREGGTWRYIEADHALVFSASRTTLRAITVLLGALDQPALAPVRAPKDVCPPR